MTKTFARRTALAMPMGLLPLALTSCDDAKKANVAGTQIPVLPQASPLSAAPNAPLVTVPAPVAMGSYPQNYATPTHAPGNVAGPLGLSRLWRTGIGEGGGYRQPLQALPVLAEGKIFAMDANANIKALSAASGTELWRFETRPKHVTELNISGGLAYDGGTLYASTGYAEILAINPASGKVIWRQKLDYPARSAPTVAAGIIAVITQNDLLLSFDAKTGAPGWRFLGKVTDSPTSVAVLGAPSFQSGIMVAGFSSGTLAALNASSGTPIWEQSLAGSLSFSDIAAATVIAGGVVYAISLGGTMQAIDLHSGAKVWEHTAAGGQTMCAAGNFVYALTTDQKLAAIHQDDGLVSWTLDVPAFKNMKKLKNPISWAGPVMVNSMLLLTSDHGDIAIIDPVHGAIASMAKIDGPADLPPIAVDNMLLVLTRNAALTAYR